jgi:hypothetical protein
VDEKPFDSLESRAKVVDTYVVKHGYHNRLPNRYGSTEKGTPRYGQPYRPSRHPARDFQSNYRFPGRKMKRAKFMHEGRTEVRTDSNKKVSFDQKAEVTRFRGSNLGHYARDCPRSNLGAM